MKRFDTLFLSSLLAVSLAAFGCSDSGDSSDAGIRSMDAGKGPCTTEPPDPVCEQSCGGDEDCPSGFYCGDDGTCTAQCGPGGGCPATHRCESSTGRCIAESGPCASDDPFPGCGDLCTRDADCPFTTSEPTFCLGSICTAECDPATHEGCEQDEFCNVGECLPGARPSDSGTGDACVPTTIEPEPVTPTVILIVDQSASMDSSFGSVSRWTAVNNALTEMPGGLVTELQGVVRFGMAMYSATNCEACTNGTCQCEEPAVGQCPLIHDDGIDPALNNLAPIDSALEADTIEDTPTGDTVDWTRNWLRGFPEVPDSGDLNWNGDPIVFIIATDGEPDRCENGDPGDLTTSRNEVITAVQAAFSESVRSFIISVGDEIAESHLQDVANVGVGLPVDATDGADFWQAGDQAGLASALQEIVTGEISCTIPLEGTIEDLDTVCEDGSVSLTVDGTETNLTCQGTCDTATGDGWCAANESTIELLGSPCDTLQSGEAVQLNATFDCGAFVCPECG